MAFFFTENATFWTFLKSKNSEIRIIALHTGTYIQRYYSPTPYCSMGKSQKCNVVPLLTCKQG